MMYRAGVVSYCGPALMSDFGEYGAMHDYTVSAIKELLFEANSRYEIKKCDYWIKDMPAWQAKNIDIVAKKVSDKMGYEVLQGRGKVAGKFLGGCLDALPMAIGTEIWPGPEDWNGTLLFFEISDDISNPDHIAYILRNLGVQGILGSAAGMIIGKPKGEKFYNEYKTVFRQVLKEFVREDIPVLYNVNFGHCQPIGIIPYGIQCELDVDRKTITLLESVVE